MAYSGKYKGSEIDNLLDKVSSLSSESKQNVVVDQGEESEYVLQPNQILVVAHTGVLHLRINEIVIPQWDDNLDISEQQDAFYAEYTVVFRTVASASLILPDNVLWANGEVPELEDDCEYELSISYRGEVPDTGCFKAVLVPFKAAEV